MIKQILLLSVSLFLLSITVFAGAIKEGSLRGSSNNSSITLTWGSDDESGVQKFVIERKAGTNGSFMLLAEVQPKGSNSMYQYVDDTAFRIMGSIYIYQVKVVFSNGTVATYGPILVPHNTSEVRRTWGSIKAMFR